MECIVRHRPLHLSRSREASGIPRRVVPLRLVSMHARWQRPWNTLHKGAIARTLLLGDNLKTYAARRSLAAATLAGLLLTGTSCAGPQAGAPQPSAAVPAATGTPAPQPAPATTTSAPASTTPAPVPPPAPAIPAPVPATPIPGEVTVAPTEAPRAARLQTFTFPDGHLSFTYPAGWSVRTKQGPYLTEEEKTGSVDALVYDGSGVEVASVLSGMYGDGAAGPVKRTVLDRAPVPGVSVKGQTPEFGFAVDEYLDGDRYYFMDVRNAPEFNPGQGNSGTNQVRLGNGMMVARVIFDFEKQPTFVSPAAAKDWMATKQYSQLKALLLSLNYS
jgi:hypothetical protein